MNKQFKKQDLKTGMVLENKEGNKYLFMQDDKDGVIIRDGVHDYIKYFKDDLSQPNCDKLSIVRIYSNRSFDDALSLINYGKLLWEREEDKFKDLKRAFAEGAEIEYTLLGSREWYNVGTPCWRMQGFEYRIKGNISIESWDAHKEVIKEYWNGAEIEYMWEHSIYWNITTVYLWEIETEYRVKVEKTEELTIEQIEKKLGYKIKVVGEQ